MYSQKVMEHFMNPKNVGEIENPDGVSEEGNPVCGDVMRFYIKVENGRIADIKFKTFGCGAAIASASALTEMVKGKPIEEVEKITRDMLVEELGGLPPNKLHCSLLAVKGIKSAIENWRQKKGGNA
jgi:nitrogen fixation NifU-like protein